MHYTTLGPGDEITWGSYTGHPLDPRNCTDDDNGLDEWEADEMAAEQLASTADEMLSWLADVTRDDEASKPVETNMLDDAQLQDASAAVLLACIFVGDDRQANFARMFLRQRFEAARRQQISDLSAQLYARANHYDDDEEF